MERTGLRCSIGVRPAPVGIEPALLCFPAVGKPWEFMLQLVGLEVHRLFPVKDPGDGEERRARFGSAG